MDWLFNGSLIVIAILAIVTVVLFVLYWQTRQRNMLYATAGAGVLLVGYFLLDLAIETDREADVAQIKERLEQMEQAVADKDAERLFQHISDKFQSPKGASREATLSLAKVVFSQSRVTGLEIWEEEFPEDFSREVGQGTVTFLFKLRGNLGNATEMFFQCESTWEYTADKGWMLTKVRILDPTKNNEEHKPF